MPLYGALHRQASSNPPLSDVQVFYHILPWRELFQTSLHHFPRRLQTLKHTSVLPVVVLAQVVQIAFFSRHLSPTSTPCFVPSTTAVVVRYRSASYRLVASVQRGHPGRAPATRRHQPRERSPGARQVPRHSHTRRVAAEPLALVLPRTQPA